MNISFKDFQKINLVVGLVEKAERIEESEKLIKLIVDIGAEKREIVAGIGEKYSKEDLVDKKIAIVANLEPKTIFGYQSNGMILAADLEGEPFVIFIDDNVPPGSQIR
ncbi:MAG: methionine--tRNA ligase subunit beta [Minisyncoccales bacterium]|jgi:methionine--tRNA ligase beta chain